MNRLLTLIAVLLAVSCARFRPSGVGNGEDVVVYFAAARDRAAVYERFQHLGYDPSSDTFKRLVVEETPKVLTVDLIGGKGNASERMCRLRFTFAPSGELESVVRSPHVGNPDTPNHENGVSPLANGVSP